MSKTAEGYLLIADITGYTWYLSESELDHAQDTLTELLELLVDHTRPPLIISRLAGDAVISYGLHEHFFQGQTFVEIIENTYVAFRQRIELMVMNNTCRCNACANVSRLNLKFFLHFGSFGIQRIADHDELVGNDVNLIHRLLKNSVTETTGVKAYVLYSEAAIKRLKAEELLESMTPHEESYEHLGRVKVWVQDLKPVWEGRRKETAVEFPEEEVDAESFIDIEVPPERLWDYLMLPEFRNALIGTDRMEITNRSRGRIATGSVYQCYHGDRLVPQTIVAWQPFERIVVKQPFPMAPANSMMGEYRLEPTENGTRFTIRSTSPSGPFMGRLIYTLMRPMIARAGPRLLGRFKQRVEEDYRQRPDITGGEAMLDTGFIRQAATDALRASTPSAGQT